MTGRELLRRVERLGCAVRPPARFARDRPLPGRVPDRDPDPPRPGHPDRHAAEHRACARAVPRRGVAAMSRTKNYVAVYERDPESDAWLVHIKGIAGCQTYGRSLRQAEDRIREALALWLDRDPDGLIDHTASGRQSLRVSRSKRRKPAATQSEASGACDVDDDEGSQAPRPHGPQPSRRRRHPRHLSPTCPAAAYRVRDASTVGSSERVGGPDRKPCSRRLCVPMRVRRTEAASGSWRYSKSELSEVHSLPAARVARLQPRIRRP